MKAVLTVRYLSGREEQFEFESWGGAGVEGRLQEFVKSPTIVLQTPDGLVIIPASAIESVLIALPEGMDEEARPTFKTIRHAKRLK
jgi:hypothetical protein